MKNLKYLFLFVCVGLFFSCTQTDEKTDSKAYISVTVAEENVSVIQDLDTFVLKGTPNGGTEKTFGSWQDFSEMTSSEILCDTGTWNFTLTAYHSEVLEYTGTISNKQIVTGTNNLNFSMKEATYTITYNLCGGYWADYWYTPKTEFTKQEEVILPNAEYIRSGGLHFYGWYTDLEDKKNTVITGWNPNEVTQDKVLYAGWDIDINKLADAIKDIRYGEHTIEVYGTVNNLEECASAVYNAKPYWGYNYKWNNLVNFDMSNVNGIDNFSDAWFSKDSSVYFDSSNPLNGGDNGEGTRSLQKIILPNSCTSIGDCAFYYCINLTSIKIPDGCTSIGRGAFWKCESLTSITIPSCTSIGDSAFGECESLSSVTIPNGCTSIGSYAFYGCGNLSSITIPSCTSIGSYAFMYCKSLTSITIPNGCTSIGDYAFSECENLTSITIPDGCTSIGKEAFKGCTSLTSITTLDGCTSIGDSAFVWCESLTSITIPDGCTSIGKEAFYGCKSLTSITIPNGCTSIGDHTFVWCESLTSITIPDGCTSIGKEAFKGCESLTSITFLSTTPPDYFYTSSIPTSVSIYVPKGYGDTYKSADGWSTYASKIFEMEE